MKTPKIKIEMNKGKPGVKLQRLAEVAEETLKFLVGLSIDLQDPESEWIAENFQNGSLCFDLRRQRESHTDLEIWNKALSAVMDNNFSDDEINVRIRPETRAQFFEIAKVLADDEVISFGVQKNGDEDEVEWHPLDREQAQKAEIFTGPKLRNHGEIQGIVHAFYKETKQPKLVIRELSTRKLIDCFFNETMYAHAVALLEDKSAVIFVEGEASEDVDGSVTDISVSDFTPAPSFDENTFENLIGAFPGALTGNIDAQKALDNYRDNG